MVFSFSLGILMGIGVMSAAAGIAPHHESAPPAPADIPEPLASSCRTEAQASYDQIKSKSNASEAAQWVQIDYGLVAGMNPRYLDFQRQGQLGIAETVGERPAENRFIACLYAVRLQMLAGSVPQWHPGEPIPRD
jgi:hypothetical protein